MVLSQVPFFGEVGGGDDISNRIQESHSFRMQLNHHFPLQETSEEKQVTSKLVNSPEIEHSFCSVCFLIVTSGFTDVTTLS